MRKEVIIAIVAGIAFGVILAFGIWRANSALKEEVTTEIVESEVVSTPSPTPDELDIALARPTNYDVLTSSPSVITGVTQPDSWIIVSGEVKDYYLKSDDTGKFEQEVEFVGGVNQLIITAYKQDGKSVTDNLLIVYSTEFLNE